jgi:hypothetical protein
MMNTIATIYRKRRNYLRHAALFTFYLLGMAVFLPAQDFWREMVRLTLPNTGDLILIAFLWAAFFIAHSATQWMNEREYRAIRAAWLAGDDLKTKRAEIRLSDDGELIDFDSAAWEANTTNGKRKRG